MGLESEGKAAEGPSAGNVGRASALPSHHPTVTYRLYCHHLKCEVSWSSDGHESTRYTRLGREGTRVLRVGLDE